MKKKSFNLYEKEAYIDGFASGRLKQTKEFPVGDIPIGYFREWELGYDDGVEKWNE